MIAKVVPERAGLSSTHTRDVYYGYDVRDLQTYARFDGASGEGIANSYDTLGRLTGSTLTMNGVARTLGYTLNAAGSRTQLTLMDGAATSFSYDAAGRMQAIYEGALASTPRCGPTATPNMAAGCARRRASGSSPKARPTARAGSPASPASPPICPGLCAGRKLLVIACCGLCANGPSSEKRREPHPPHPARGVSQSVPCSARGFPRSSTYDNVLYRM